jgi:hypothetical protein
MRVLFLICALIVFGGLVRIAHADDLLYYGDQFDLPTFPAIVKTTPMSITTAFTDSYIEDGVITEIINDDFMVITTIEPTITTFTPNTAPVSDGKVQILVSVAIFGSILVLIILVGVVFTRKSCKIIGPGFDNPQFLLDGSSSEENLPPLTPRVITRTVSDRGLEMGIMEEGRLHDIRNRGKKENTLPVGKTEATGK